ncbi:MAG: hypothetical protein K6A30_04290 [Lachnospiraceae bacterium]|nr:hypothetical protein [Lachnospiraceae bacterium]
MAVRKASSNDNSRELIMNLRDVRDTVRDERAKRLAREGSAAPTQIRTYHSGQESRMGKGTRKSKRR